MVYIFCQIKSYFRESFAMTIREAKQQLFVFSDRHNTYICFRSQSSYKQTKQYLFIYLLYERKCFTISPDDDNNIGRQNCIMMKNDAIYKIVTLQFFGVDVLYTYESMSCFEGCCSMCGG